MKARGLATESGSVMDSDSASARAGTPVPLSATTCGLPAASSLTCSVACRVANAPGVKVTAMAQLAPAASVPGQSVVRVKSLAAVPLTSMPTMTRAALPLFVRVTACGALTVPTA